MKVRITVGEVDLRLDGLEMTRKEVTALIKTTASIAVALAEAAPAEITVGGHPIGFSAHLERADPAGDDFSEYFEDEE